MSDGIDIRSGGAVAVDTATLHRVAEGLASLAIALDSIHAQLHAERGRLAAADSVAGPAVWRATGAMRLAADATDAATALSDKALRSATVYEIVELRAERAAAVAGGDTTAVAALDVQIAVLSAHDPWAYFHALSVETLWSLAAPNELARQAASTPLGALGASTASVLAVAIGLGGRGRVAQDGRLSGPAPAVDTRQVGVTASGTPPKALAALVDRIPREPAQVRVERYAMPDGTRRFAVYIAGTRSPMDPREPWNSSSNVALYSGQRSASYEATMQALEHAGAQPGDAVYAVGHSQGGMIASHLALDEQYDVRAVVTLGSPVSADVGGNTLSVQLRHTDDPVVALAAGGNPGRVGAEQSFVAERVADPEGGIQDLALAAHHLDEYRETAAMVDASSDPRAAAVGGVLAELGEAEKVEVFDYAAVRPAPTPSPGYFIPPTPMDDKYGGAAVSAVSPRGASGGG